MLIQSITLLLLSTAVTQRRDKSILFSRTTVLMVMFCLFICFNTMYISYIEKGFGLFGGLYHITANTQIFHLFMFIISATILQLTSFYSRKVKIVSYDSVVKSVMYSFNYYRTKIINKMAQQYKILEYSLILLFVVTGAAFLISTSDFVSIFLSIELQSYGLYLFCTLYRDSESATSGGLTYFLLGGLSSCFILLGLSLLYANSGTTSMDGLYIINSLSNITHSSDNNNIVYWYKSYYISFSLLIMSVGFLFKVSAAPFHFWSPDVYDAIPTIATTFVAILGKISIFIFLLELVHYTSSSLITQQFTWTLSLLMSSLLSLIIGTVVGLTQSRIKRLFAYSTISHVGFILLALSINSVESIQAFLFYLMQYSISNLNAFILLLAAGWYLFKFVNNNNEYSKLLDKNNSPIQLISQIKGYFYINPVLALSLSITIFSFVGIPPLIGFFAKQMVLSAALDSGYTFLVLIGILTSVIGAVYYLAIIKQMFFDKPEYKINPELENLNMYGYISQINTTTLVEKVSFKVKNIVLSSHLTITISVLTLIILLFIFVPQEWLSMINILSLTLFNP